MLLLIAARVASSCIQVRLASRDAELRCSRVDRVLRLRNKLVDFLFADDERRRQQHTVAARAHNQIAIEAEVPANAAHIATISKAFARCGFFRKLQSRHQSGTGDLTDNRMVREGVAQFLLEVGSRIGLDALDNFFRRAAV